MDVWEELSEIEQNEVWALYYRRFGGMPGGLVNPHPSVTYSISGIYGEHDRAVRLFDDLNKKMLAAFRECIEPSSRMYALDWQHPCYWFYPHVPFDADDPKAWPVPILPNGDYYSFLAEDVTFGSLGHPWEMSITIYGAALIDAVNYDKPLLFDYVMRSNEVPTSP